MKKFLLILLLLLTACGASTPEATPTTLRVQYTAAARPWLAPLQDCATDQAATLLLEPRSADFFDPVADLAMRIGEPAAFPGPAYRVGEEEIVLVVHPQNPVSLLDRATGLGLQVTTDVATNLLMGLVSDTIGCRTSSVTPTVLRDAAHLIELGAPLREVYERGLNRHSFTSIRYWGAGLGRLERDHGLVWAELTLDDRRRVGYPGPDDADLINLMSSIDGADVTVIFVEQADDRTKVSWRARDGINVARVAGLFGGGGHEQASGAMVSGRLEDVKRIVLDATRKAMQAAARGEA